MSSDMHFKSARLVICLIAIVILYGTAMFLYTLYTVRTMFLRMQKQGMPMPPYHPIFGHLPILKKVSEKLPADVHGHCLPAAIRREVPGLGPVFYVDSWPFGPLVLVASSPSAAHQITQERSLPKFPGLTNFLRPLSGLHNLVTMEGDLWKTWRAKFNPGFSAGHLMTLVPAIMKDVLVFRDILKEYAEKDALFQLDLITVKMTMDVIGRVVFDTELNTQRSNNEMVSALHRQAKWLSFGIEINPLTRYNPIRPLVHWYNTRIMNRYITAKLQDHFTARRNDLTSQHHNKSIIDLALDSYLTSLEKGSSAASDPPKTPKNPISTLPAIDKTFLHFATSQIKLFLFAGHDTASSTICYILHLLSTHPAALARLRAEHTSVLGPSLPAVPDLLASSPHLLNNLPYTLAVVKETLRLFPPASSSRTGYPGHVIRLHNDDENLSLSLPTDGFFVWSNHHALHRDESYWTRAHEFLPERWLAKEEDPLHPLNGAWRPFEFGPRTCVGQELAMLEMKITLVVVAREFEVSEAYREWDAKKPTGWWGSSSWLQGWLVRSKEEEKVREVDGERAYQILLGGAHPSERFPCRVRMVRESE